MLAKEACGAVGDQVGEVAVAPDLRMVLVQHRLARRLIVVEVVARSPQ